MNKILYTLILVLITSLTLAAEIKVLSVSGDVKVRQGVNEDWRLLNIGEKLGIEDAVRIGSKSSALLILDDGKKIALPDQSIVEIADLRKLTREELLLKLAMERILVVPPQDRSTDLIPPRTTIIHGEKRSDKINSLPESSGNATLILNGAKILYDNQYFGTFILRVKEVFRIYPDASDRTDFRLMSANALEKTNLYQEALNEYAQIPQDNLSADRKLLLQQNIDRLVKKLKD